jgi:predicted DNA-binding protein
MSKQNKTGRAKRIPPSKRIGINISISTIDRLDRYAQKHSAVKCRLVEQAIENYLNQLEQLK